jgi:outer membrane protein OmpA-like peptidoglycan-associated protein
MRTFDVLHEPSAALLQSPLVHALRRAGTSDGGDHDVPRTPGSSSMWHEFAPPVFGHDFSRVPTHTDPSSDEAMEPVRAVDFTVGGIGRTPGGLLAHDQWEAATTMQSAEEPTKDSSAAPTAEPSLSAVPDVTLGPGLTLRTAQGALTVEAFEHGRAALPADQLKSLESHAAQLRGLLESDPAATIQISGRVDAGGTEQFDLGLSQSRADAVKQILIDNGVPATQIVVKQVGASTTARAGRPAGEANRSAEIRYLPGLGGAPGAYPLPAHGDVGPQGTRDLMPELDLAMAEVLGLSEIGKRPPTPEGAEPGPRVEIPETPYVPPQRPNIFKGLLKEQVQDSPVLLKAPPLRRLALRGLDSLSSWLWTKPQPGRAPLFTAPYEPFWKSLMPALPAFPRRLPDIPVHLLLEIVRKKAAKRKKAAERWEVPPP